MIFRSAYIMILFVALLTPSCDRRDTVGEPATNKVATASPTPEAEAIAHRLFLEDQEKAKSAREASARFMNQTEAFKGTDFRSFTFPVRYPALRIKLRNGRFHYEEKPSGGGWFKLGPVYYLDLTGDGNEEALLGLTHVSCGASCDGGSYRFFVYSAGNGKPEVRWQFRLGGLKYGCGLRKITVVNGHIEIDLLGNCVRKSDRYFDVVQDDLKFPNNFAGHTTFTFAWDGKSFKETGRSHTGKEILEWRGREAIFEIVSGSPPTNKDQ